MKIKNLVVILFCILFSLQAFSKESKPNIYDAIHVTGALQKIDTLTAISKKNINSAETAIILIPGLNSVSLKNEFYEWKNLWNFWQSSKQLTEAQKGKYAFFVFRYDGWQSLFSASSLLESGLNELLIKQPNLKKITFIGYSQGGLIARIINSKSSNLSLKINKIITLASPHQGTVTLTENWTRSVLKNQNFLERAKNEKLLQFLKNRYKYAYYEQAWTNFDDNIPASAKYTVPPEALSIPQPDKEDLNKFIVYGSYIYPPYAQDFEGFLKVNITESVLRNLLNRESAMNELNRWMAAKNHKDEKPSLRDNLRLNDGVIPLSSALWAKVCETNQNQPENWQKIFPTNNYCPTVHLQRAFYGFNHLAWRMEVSGNKKAKDLFHPNLPKKSPYEWLVEDLIFEDNKL